jgi:hemerythrin-like domain-containing protein
MAIFDLLREEHDQIKGMLAAVRAEGRKGDAFEEARARIEIHMEGEEEHVYPELRAAGLKDEVLEALEEHHVARILLGELDDMSDREEAWMPKFRVLTEVVERHLRQEERSVFTGATKTISRARQEELEAEYRRFASSLAQAGTSLPRSESPFYGEM